MVGTARIVSLYNRHCLQGQRAELARQLVTSDPKSAIVRVGAIETVVGTATGEDGTAMPAESVSPPAAENPSNKPKPKPARQHKVVRGDTLMSISRKYDCRIGELAKANGIKAPRYTVKPGQQIRLEGCGG